MWGPYSSALLPGLWLLEGGQSAAGKLVDHIIDTHPASAEAKRKAGKNSVYCFLEEVLETMKREAVSNGSGLRVIRGQYCSRVAASPCLSNGPIT